MLILFRKGDEQLYFLIRIKAFSWLGFVAGYLYLFFQVQVENYFVEISFQGKEGNHAINAAQTRCALTARVGFVVSLKCQE